MTIQSILLLFFAAMCGGAMNAVAGGGTFFTFPTLIFTGVPAISAQATSAFALLPGGIASIGAYRRELARIPRRRILALVVISILGGILGATLLKHTAENVFLLLVPYLLLIATLLFAFSGPITRRLRMHSQEQAKRSPLSLVGVGLVQLVIATYGGYFSGGQSILILTALALLGMENIHEMNGLKSLLASCINTAAVFTFILLGGISWPQALLMAVGAMVGGYGGASIARKIDPKWVRIFVIGVGTVLTIWFFYQSFTK